MTRGNLKTSDAEMYNKKCQVLTVEKISMFTWLIFWTGANCAVNNYDRYVLDVRLHSLREIKDTTRIIR